MNERRAAIAKAKQAQNEARADLAYGQGLWYAWGRIDSGEYSDCIHCGEGPDSHVERYGVCLKTRTTRYEILRLNAFDFAQSVKMNQLNFEEERTHMVESIQGQWAKFVADERAAQK